MKIYKVVSPDGNTTYVIDIKKNVPETINTMTPEQLAAIGWYMIEDVPKPSDTNLITYDMKIDEVDGIPTITWIERAKTVEEKIKDDVLVQIDTLNSLLGVSGVIDLTTLRGIKAIANTDINSSPAKYLKAIIDIVIKLVKAERKTSRLIARRFDSVE